MKKNYEIPKSKLTSSKFWVSNKLDMGIKCILIIFLFIAGSLITNAQTFDGFKEVYSQSDVNDLGAEGYSNITQGLYIRNSSDITDLTPLSSLTSLGALFIGDNLALTNLNGLQNITQITGVTGEGLYIARNALLPNLNGLGGINTVGARLVVENNPSLVTLSGLNVSQVEQINFFQNNALQNLNGLDNLTIVGSSGISLSGLPALTDLSGLNALTTVAGINGIIISDCSSLVQINGFNSLVNTNLLQITGNPLVSNYCGLTNWATANPTFSNFLASANAYNPSLQQVITACDGAAANSMTAISDPVFEQYLIQNGTDTNNTPDGFVLTSAISNLTELIINSFDISDFTGLEDFSALVEFEMINNQATTIQPISFIGNAVLDKITIINSPNLVSVDITQNNVLTDVAIVTRGTVFNSIDLTGKTNLLVLQLADNDISSIDLSPVPNLTYLGLAINPITSLNVSGFADLEVLDTYESQITSLDLSANSKLTRLDSNDGALTSVNLKNGFNNLLTSVDLDGNAGLSCIQVDDVSLATQQTTAGNWVKDAAAAYSINCNAPPTTQIPDDAFEAYLEDIGAGDGIANNDLVNLIAVQNVTILNMAGGFNGQQIQSLTGIDAFSILETLDVSNNQLTVLPLASNNSLVSLKANNNQIASVAFSNPSSLEIIELNSNNLSSIDLSNLSGSEVLLLNENGLTSIDFSSTPGLEVVDVGDNLLTALDITNMAPILNTLNFSLNQIPNIDLSSATALSSLIAFQSGLTSLSLKNLAIGQLATINVNLNQGLTCIEVSNVASAEQEVSNGNWFVDPIPGIFKLDCSAVSCTTLSISDVNFEAYLENPANTFFDALGNQVFPSDGFANNNFVCLDAIALIDELNIDGTLSTVDIVSFDGISNFSALTKFKLRATPLGLTTLDLASNTGLIEIDIRDTGIENLTLPTNTAVLQKVTLIQNNLSGGIDLSGNTELTEIQAILSTFSTVNTTNCTALQILNFDNGSISALDLSTNTNLRELILDATPITDLELTGGVYPNLTSIVVARSNMENLTIRNTAITSINLNEMNNLKLVDIEENILLKTVSLNNPGTEPTTIERLSIRANDLTGTLDIANIPGITTIDVSSNPNLIVLDVTNQVNLEFLATFGSGITTLDLSTNNGTLSELNLGTTAAQSNLISLNLLKPTNNLIYTDFILATDNNPNLNCIQVHSTFDAEEAVNQGFWSVENVPAIFNLDCSTVANTLIQFEQLFSDGLEGDNSNLPRLVIDGTVTTASTVTIRDSGGGTASPSTTTIIGDYTLGGGNPTYTMTIQPGVYTFSDPIEISEFSIIDDTAFEDRESIQLEISNVTGDFTLGVEDFFEYNITNDDYKAGIIADGSEASENGDTGRFTIELFDDNGNSVFNNTGDDIFVEFEFSGTAGLGDFNSPIIGVTIPNGSGNAFIPIEVIDDAIVEGTETVICTLQPAFGYQLDNSQPLSATVNILDNDSGTPTTFEAEVQVITDILNIANVNEGNTEIELQMFIPNADTDNLLLDFDVEVIGMTATADEDFRAVPANETFSYEYFNDGLSLYNIGILQDGLLESNEQFIIRISNPSDSRVQLKNADANGVLEFVITILDNETANAVLMSKDGIEGGNAEFTVRLQDDNGNPITNNTGSDIDFDILLSDGTATAPADYTNPGANTKITIGNSAAGGFIEVPLLDDTAAEPQENLSATISNPSFGSVTITQATANANIAPSDNTGGDSDSDGVLDADDNCPNTSNANQADLDADGEGDVCDMDRDGDGVLNVDDTCPDLAGVAANNGCPQADSDGDGILDVTDNCINTANADQLDTDGDGIGDLCDTDIDGDGIPNNNDNCIIIANPGQEDADNNGIGDVCDTPDTTSSLILNPEDLSIIVQAESCPDVPNGSLVLVADADQEFTVTITSSNLATPLQGSLNMTTLYIAENLAAGAYAICITAAAYPAFEQCFVANVLNSDNISVVSQSLDLSAKTALFSVEGSTKYSVQVNTEIYEYNFDTTKARLIEVPMEDGQNQIQITGASECQGIFKDEIFLGKVTAYPNPVVDTLHLSGISGSETSEISIVNLNGTVVRKEMKNNASGDITINVSDLSSGLYVVYVKNATQDSSFKIIKN